VVQALLVLRGVHQGNMGVHNVDTKGGGKYRDIGSEMECELLRHLGGIHYTLPGRSFYDCPTSAIVPVQVVGLYFYSRFVFFYRSKMPLSWCTVQLYRD
jgi:hypothetical protein